jgi:hypothetical protein
MTLMDSWEKDDFRISLRESRPSTKVPTLLHIVKITTFYLRRYGQNCPYCRKIEKIYKKKN